MSNPLRLAQEAAHQIGDKLGKGFDAVAVLGAGWDEIVSQLGTTEAQVSTSELVGFAPPRVVGHDDTVAVVAVDDYRILTFCGRLHLYEGHSAAAVAHGVRTAAAAGCEVAFLINESGALRAHDRVGRPVIISDHLNLTGDSPVEGAEFASDRFVDLVGAYSPRLRTFAAYADPDVSEGVLAGMRGPNFETPAEVEMLRRMGADLVAFSLIMETIAARHCGLEVLGLSLVTNLAAGMVVSGPRHEEVLRAGASSGARVARLLRGVIERI